jgi:hypothetical protein
MTGDSWPLAASIRTTPAGPADSGSPTASARPAWSFVKFRCSSTDCAELIHKHGQELVVEGRAQPPGPGECRQAVKTAPGDLGECLCVAVASQRGQRLT